MGVLATVDLILALMGKLNLGVNEALTFYDSIRQKHPELPELTDAEVITKMKATFTQNKLDALAELARLDAKVAEPTP